ncbi:MAG: ATP-binding protein [Paludibacter sp.]
MDTVRLDYVYNEIGHIKEITITDTGYGINFSKLATKFDPFYESEKIIEISSPKNISTMHGRNGVGRLTFFTFATRAKWITTFKENNELFSGSIEIEADRLNKYQHSLPKKSLARKTGTEVSFDGISISQEELENSIIPFLICEFCWFLELNKSKNFQIIINGTPLDYKQNITSDDPTIDIIYKDSNTLFRIKYIQWKESLHKEFSKYYFLSNEGEVYKDYTTLNNKGDEFYHSVYIQSSFFDDFNFKSSEEDGQILLFGKARSSPEYKFLIKEVDIFLRNKRKPFLRTCASKLVEQYEQGGILPTYENEWEETLKKPLLRETIMGLYEAQPKLFSSLNIDQKKTFVRLLDLLLDSNERDRLFKIINEIVELEPEERQDLADLFKTTRLNRIVETLKLIEDRYKTCYKLKDLVFNPDLKANEVDHLQKVIESHYWIFGEQYHLVTAAEPKFDEALRRYHYLLYQDDVDKKMTHPNKYKEMDIFACRQNTLIDKIENIVIELKHPNIKLGRNQYIQVDKYLEAILSEPAFNASNMTWEFYLVGNDFDNSGFIDRQLETNANHGIKSLINWSDKGRIKIYAKRWSEIFAEFEIKHKFIDEKLKLERNQLANELKTANETVESVQNNSAVQPEEVKIPNDSK